MRPRLDAEAAQTRLIQAAAAELEAARIKATTKASTKATKKAADMFAARVRRAEDKLARLEAIALKKTAKRALKKEAKAQRKEEAKALKEAEDVAKRESGASAVDAGAAADDAGEPRETPGITETEAEAVVVAESDAIVQKLVTTPTFDEACVDEVDPSREDVTAGFRVATTGDIDSEFYDHMSTTEVDLLHEGSTANEASEVVVEQDWVHGNEEMQWTEVVRTSPETELQPAEHEASEDGSLSEKWTTLPERPSLRISLLARSCYRRAWVVQHWAIRYEIRALCILHHCSHLGACKAFPLARALHCRLGQS